MWRPPPHDNQHSEAAEGPFPSPSSASAEYSDDPSGPLTAASAGSSQLGRRASDYDAAGSANRGRPDASSAYRYPAPTSITRPIPGHSPHGLAYVGADRSNSVSSMSTDTSHSQQIHYSQTAFSPTSAVSHTPDAAGPSRTPRQGEIWIAAKEPGPSSQPAAPRKRGRPRKEPSSTPAEPKRETKNRTKTGCITCRKRKKKCTEERPVCSSCQKNNYACVYPGTEVYKTGKEKADEQARRASLSLPRPLPSLFEGIESPMDRKLLHHFIHKCSPVLSMNTGGRNLYLTHMLPMAAEHGPLMHALLALSASHLSHRPSSTDSPPDEALIDHQFTLHSLAIRGMRQGLTEQQTSINDQTMAINLLALLYTVAEGQVDGAYHQHLAAAKTMSGLLRSDSEEFCDFIYENLQYHATLSALLSTKAHAYTLIPRPNGMSQSPKGQLIGIYCNLFSVFSRVSRLRRTVRDAVMEEGTFLLDSAIYAEAAEIDAELRQWIAPFEEGSEKWIAAQICQRATWAYLRRTMSYPSPGQEMHAVMDDALELFDHLSSNDSSFCCLLFPMFLLGCCAFEEEHRSRIAANIDRLYGHSELRNVEITKDFVHALWRKMDEDIRGAWDWETLAASLHVDFLIS